MNEIMDSSLNDLKEWLLSRETDIAYEIEDFGELRDVFWDVIGRYPEK
ncbi:MAG: hypothetical protein O7D95_03025 [Betaproteobacteria bacterium]|nr:hypothetical protein [Betaproteobacteria bacterium]